MKIIRNQAYTKVISLSNWKDRTDIAEMGKIVNRTVVGRGIRSSTLDFWGLEYSLNTQS